MGTSGRNGGTIRRSHPEKLEDHKGPIAAKSPDWNRAIAEQANAEQAKSFLNDEQYQKAMKEMEQGIAFLERLYAEGPDYQAPF